MGALAVRDDPRSLLTPPAVSAAFESVRVEKLTKLYGRTRALAGVSAEFPAGQVTVVEGPNGSGKSTLLQLLSLQARPTRGTIHFVNGAEALDARRARAALRGKIGILAHAPMLYPELSGAENLAFYAELHGEADVSALVGELRERFEIGSFGDRPVRTYSRGQLQRVALGRALIGAPALLLLDEPSTGLDHEASERLFSTVRAERERGAIIVLVTHAERVASALADRRVRLHRGARVVEEAS